jgi:hypothetical protein
MTKTTAAQRKALAALIAWTDGTATDGRSYPHLTTLEKLADAGLAEQVVIVNGIRKTVKYIPTAAGRAAL